MIYISFYAFISADNSFSDSDAKERLKDCLHELKAPLREMGRMFDILSVHAPKEIRKAYEQYVEKPYNLGEYTMAVPLILQARDLYRLKCILDYVESFFRLYCKNNALSFECEYHMDNPFGE